MSIVYTLKNNSNLYLNITNKCSNRCYFCFKHFWKGIGNINLQLQRDPSPKQIIKELQQALDKSSTKKEVVFCGFGEPTTRLDTVIQVTKVIKKQFRKPTRLDTNGLAYKLNPEREVVDELANAGIDRVCVSVNAYNKELYNSICKPGFADAFDSVLYFVQKAKEAFDTEITAVTLAEVDMTEMAQFAESLGVRFRKRPYIPTFY
jgi:TatD family-associated radical SAM protein